MKSAHVASLLNSVPLPSTRTGRRLVSLCLSALAALALCSTASPVSAQSLRNSALMLTSASGNTSGNSDQAQLLQQIDAAESAEDDLLALDLYQQLLALSPHEASLWNRHGLTAMRLQDYSLAIQSLSRAVRDHPVKGAYYEGLAWAMLGQGDFAGASAQSRTAILMYQRENDFSLYPFFIRFFAEHAMGQAEQANLSLRYASRNLRDRSWPLPALEYLSGQLPKNQLLATIANLRQETEAHLLIGLREYLIGDAESGRRHLTWAAAAGDRQAAGQAIAKAFQDTDLKHRVGSL